MFANTFELPWNLARLTAWFNIETDCRCLQKI